MTVHIALLRGVNAAGNRQVTADELTALLIELGHADVHAGPKVGDLVLTSGAQTGAELQAQIETALMDRFSLRTDVYVRTADAWRAMVAANPFPEFAAQRSRLADGPVLQGHPRQKAMGRPARRNPWDQQARAESRQMQATYPDGIGGSKRPTAWSRRHRARGSPDVPGRASWRSRRC